MNSPLLPLFLSLAAAGPVLAAGKSTVEIIPAKSFGDVAIGDTKEALLGRGFTVDTVRDQIASGYLVKGRLHVRLSQDRVVQIWIADVSQWRRVLRFRNKPFPRTITLKSLTTLFAPCDAPEQGSGGTLTACQNQGIELATSFGASEIQLSVLKK